MNALRAVLYQPDVNLVLRSTLRILKPLLPEAFRLHPSGSVKIRWEGRDLFVIQTNPTSFISRQLFYDGAENYEYSRLFYELARDCRRFYDVGANLGYYSLLTCAASPQAEVIAFEPTPGPLAYLQKNLAINGYTNRAKVVAKALGERAGRVEFYEVVNPKFPNMANLSGEHHMGTKTLPSVRSFQVEAITLDQYCSDVPGEAPDLIKIDTEGAEAMILRGGRRTLVEHRPIVIAELLFNRIESEIQAAMSDLGYAFFHIRGNRLEPAAELVRTADNGVRNVCLVPAESVDRVRPFIRVNRESE